MTRMVLITFQAYLNKTLQQKFYVRKMYDACFMSHLGPHSLAVCLLIRIRFLIYDMLASVD